MESLLRWGIENSVPTDGTLQDQHQPLTRDISRLDPGIIDQILGKPDAVQMKEALAVATDDQAEEDARVTALDNFEMLIEQIDNANNITSMNMWEPLIKLLESPSEAIKVNALWVLGTAVQNNPKAQEAFMAQSPLGKILSLIQSPHGDLTPSIRSKAVYCLSGALNHNRSAVQELEGLGGWKVLNSALTDSSAAVRRKVAFLLNSLLLPDGQPLDQPSSSRTSNITSDAMRKYAIPTSLVDALAGDNSGKQTAGTDEDFEEKAARVLMTYLEVGGRLQLETSQKIKRRIEVQEHDGEWGLTAAEWTELQRLCSNSATE